MFHINTYSLSRYIEKFEYLVDKISDFDVIGIIESGIRKNSKYKFERLLL